MKGVGKGEGEVHGVDLLIKTNRIKKVRGI